MDESSEVIREQMDATRSQLTDKLESLEQHVSNSVQSTGSAVNATVESVQTTIQSVLNAFDIQRQINQHPWLILGGAVAVGYLAAEILTGPEAKSNRPTKIVPPPPPVEKSVNPSARDAASESAASAHDFAAAYEAGAKNSSWQQLRTGVIAAMITVVQDVAARAVPEVLGFLAGNPAEPPPTAKPASPSVTSNHSDSSEGKHPQPRFNVV